MSDHYSSNIDDLERIKKIAEQFGFCLIKNVFSPDEIETAEEEMGRLWRANGGTFPDLYSCPTLRWFMLNPRVTSIARALLGEHLVYYRETSINYEEQAGDLTTKAFRQLHCDARGTPESLDAVWNTQGDLYRAYRFGVYFRNYRDYSGGLTVVPGSHKLPFIAFSKYRSATKAGGLTRLDHWLGEQVVTGLPTPPFELHNVPSMPGDLVVFNLRTMHAAGALRFVDRPTLGVLPMVEGQLLADMPEAFCPYPEEGRNTIFFDYTAPVAEPDLYIKWRAALLLRSDLHVTAELSNEYAPDLEIRNDSVISSLALALSDDLETPDDKPPTPFDALPPDKRALADTMVKLCRLHRDHSPHHTLFDWEKFDALATSSPMDALKAVLARLRELNAGLAK